MTSNMMRRIAFLLAIAGPLCGGCGGQADETTGDGGGGSDSSATGDANPILFVGTWTCSCTDTSTTDNPSAGQQPSVVQYTDLATFMAGQDGTLSLTLDTVDVGSLPVDTDGGVEGCSSFTFSVSDSTATAVSGPTCSGDGATLAFKSASFVVSGDTATIATVTSVSPQPGTTVQAATDSLTGTCTRELDHDASTD